MSELITSLESRIPNARSHACITQECPHLTLARFEFIGERHFGFEGSDNRPESRGCFRRDSLSSWGADPNDRLMGKADRLACDDVKMQMKNSLPSTGTVIGDHPKVFIPLFLCDVCSDSHHMPE